MRRLSALPKLECPSLRLPSLAWLRCLPLPNIVTSSDWLLKMGVRLAQAVLSAFVVLVAAPDVVVPAHDVQVVQVVQAAQAAVAAARAVTTVAQAQARAPAFAVDPHGVWPDRPPIAPEAEAEYEFSITMAMAVSGDVLPAWLNMFLNWMVAACVAGITSLERGKERDNLHIQATVKMKLAHEPTKKDCDTFKRHIKRALGIFQGSGTRTKMDFKPYGPGQNWEAGSRRGWAKSDN